MSAKLVTEEIQAKHFTPKGKGLSTLSQSGLSNKNSDGPVIVDLPSN